MSFRWGSRLMLWVVVALTTATVTAGIRGEDRSASAARQSESQQALPRNDRLFVLLLRSGPYRYLDGWKTDKLIDYSAAVLAFGRPTRTKVEYFSPLYDHQTRTAGFCHVSWPGAGITIKFFAFSEVWPPDEEDDPPKINPCAPEQLNESFFASLLLTGPGWRNRTGVEIGKPLAAGHRREIRQSFYSRRHGGSMIVYVTFRLDQERRVSAIDADLSWP